MTSNNDFQKDTLRTLEKKDELSKTLLAGYHGTPEYKKEEKRNFIGEFRERVLLALTKDKIGDKKYYPVIEEALKDKRAKKLLMNGKFISYNHETEYRKLAEKQNISYTTVHDRKLTGDIALVIASDKAVD